jgi:hypothetical protein
MLYLTTTDGRKIVILEPENVDEIRKGRPAVTPDKSVIITYAPDPVWLADKILDAGNDAAAIAKLIDECSKRPEKRGRKYHPVHHFKME